MNRLPSMLALPPASADPPAETTSRAAKLRVGWITDIPKISDKGQVTFSVRKEAGDPALFHDGQRTRDLGNRAQNFSDAAALNDTGQVVGRSEYRPGDYFEEFMHPFRWTTAVGMVGLHRRLAPVRDAAPLLGPIVNAAAARAGTPFSPIVHFIDLDSGGRQSSSVTLLPVCDPAGATRCPR